MSFIYYVIQKDDEAAEKLVKKLQDVKAGEIVFLERDEWQAFMEGRMITVTKKNDSGK